MYKKGCIANVVKNFGRRFGVQGLYRVLNPVKNAKKTKNLPFQTGFGWASWIRTSEMTESKSVALPLGYSPIFKLTPDRGSGVIGDPSEIRTPDTLIKSQVLCQLS